MSEMLNDLLDDVQEAEENKLTEEEIRFVVDNDQKADWALRRIREIKDEFLKWNDFYVAQTEKLKKAAEFRCHYLEHLLEEYFRKVPHKESKTQESYALPSGKLVLKEQKPEWTHDDEQLLPWVKQNVPNLVRTKESVDWAELKKELTVIWQEDGSQMITNADGEIVPGITVTERPDKFVVEVK
jgi:hypothetical protein